METDASIIAFESGRTAAAGFWQRTSNAMTGGQFDQLAVRLGPGADLDEVERLFGLEQLGGVGVEPAPGRPVASLFRVRSGSRSQSATSLASGISRPGLDVVLRHKSAADQSSLAAEARCFS